MMLAVGPSKPCPVYKATACTCKYKEKLCSWARCATTGTCALCRAGGSCTARRRSRCGRWRARCCGRRPRARAPPTRSSSAAASCSKCARGVQRALLLVCQCGGCVRSWREPARPWGCPLQLTCPPCMRTLDWELLSRLHRSSACFSVVILILLLSGHSHRSRNSMLPEHCPVQSLLFLYRVLRTVGRSVAAVLL